jgi:hypothetical protein
MDQPLFVFDTIALCEHTFSDARKKSERRAAEEARRKQDFGKWQNRSE